MKAAHIRYCRMISVPMVLFCATVGMTPRARGEITHARYVQALEGLICERALVRQAGLERGDYGPLPTEITGFKGLCGPTSLINMLRTLSRAVGNPTSYGGRFTIPRLVELMADNSFDALREGYHFGDILYFAQWFFRSTALTPTFQTSQFHYRPTHQRLKKWGIEQHLSSRNLQEQDLRGHVGGVICIHGISGYSASNDYHHAFLFHSYSNGVLKVVDPNTPDSITLLRVGQNTTSQTDISVRFINGAPSGTALGADYVTSGALWVDPLPTI